MHKAMYNVYTHIYNFAFQKNEIDTYSYMSYFSYV